MYIYMCMYVGSIFSIYLARCRIKKAILQKIAPIGKNNSHEETVGGKITTVFVYRYFLRKELLRK
jgi:hypothetical protein